MKVYVVTEGVYEQEHIIAVYDNLQDAMGDFPDDTWEEFAGDAWANQNFGSQARAITAFDVLGAVQEE